jgi:hypothetical protein
VEFYIIS